LRIDTGQTRFIRADFAGEFADDSWSAHLPAIAARQRAAGFQTLSATGITETVARYFDKQRAAATTFKMIGVGRDPFLRRGSFMPASIEPTVDAL
jgi:hypothetical protein